MLWLLYGGKGWIGGQIADILISGNEQIVYGNSRLENSEDIMDEISKIRPDRVICSIGRTSGPTCSNIDYLEEKGKIVENLRDNLLGPINLAHVCNINKIHMTYLGTGCIYEYDDQHPLGSSKGFNEYDKPNFTGSQYSAVKGTTDQLIRLFDNTLNVRIRMPISNIDNKRNFISKIIRYSKVISIPNSMTVLPELLPLMIDMSKRKITGTINLTNPGVISHGEILDLYKEYVDSSFKYTIMDLYELGNHVSSGRSNNELDTYLLKEYYPMVKNIKDAVRDVMKSYVKVDTF
jgi:3,5-epimerase/4-reductase